MHVQMRRFWSVVFVLLFVITGCSDKESIYDRKDNNASYELHRTSKEYLYEYIGTVDVSGKWFVISNELFCIPDQVSCGGHYDLEKGCYTEIGSLEYCYASSYNSEWLVFEDEDNIMKYNIKARSLEILIPSEPAIVRNKVVANNALYYYSDKPNPEKGDDRPYEAIWRKDLTTGEENIVIENVASDTGIMPDMENHDLIYFSGDCGNVIRYNCVSGEQTYVREGRIGGQHYLIEGEPSMHYSIDGNYYELSDDTIYLWKNGEKICLKDNCPMSFYSPKEGVTYSNGYMVLQTAEKIVIVDKESVYEIDKQSNQCLNDEDSNFYLTVLDVKDNEIWFQRAQYASGYDGYHVMLFSYDFQGHLMNDNEIIRLSSGQCMGIVNGNIIIDGVVEEYWEINREVDKAIIDEIEKDGLNVASYGQFEGGKTELTMYATGEDGGVYKITLD